MIRPLAKLVVVDNQTIICTLPPLSDFTLALDTRYPIVISSGPLRSNAVYITFVASEVRDSIDNNSSSNVAIAVAAAIVVAVAIAIAVAVAVAVVVAVAGAGAAGELVRDGEVLLEELHVSAADGAVSHSDAPAQFMADTEDDEDDETEVDEVDIRNHCKRAERINSFCDSLGD